MIKRLTINELKDHIKNLTLEELYKIYDGKILDEGVEYDSNTDSFMFNFANDNKTDIIYLQKVGYQINAFDSCFYYAYEFRDDVDSKLRTKFIHGIKFPNGRINKSDRNKFFINAVNKLNKDIHLSQYKVIVYPESMSELNREMMKYLSMIAHPQKYATIELIKELPLKIEFDYDKFNVEVLQAKTQDGRNRYTEKQKEDVLNNIKTMMNDIHSLDYFSIARNVKKMKYRPYIKNYYTFRNDEDRKLYENIINSNVLIVDDIVTSGTTISFLLNALRTINDTNNIVVFSLIGKNIN